MTLNTLLTITGPSGSGKTELLKMLSATGDFEKLVSVTTRPPRPGEVEGVDYYFVGKDEFESMSSAGLLLQEVSFNGFQYGTSADEFTRVQGLGKVPAVIVEPSGVSHFKSLEQQHGFVVKSLFVTAGLQTLIERSLLRLAGEPIDPVLVPYFSRRILATVDEHAKWSYLVKYDFTLYNTGSIQELEKYASSLNSLIHSLGDPIDS